MMAPLTVAPLTMAEVVLRMAEAAAMIAEAPLRAAGAALGIAQAALPRPTRDGHRQLAPRLPLGRALRRPLLSGPRSSPFHIR